MTKDKNAEAVRERERELYSSKIEVYKGVNAFIRDG